MHKWTTQNRIPPRPAPANRDGGKTLTNSELKTDLIIHIKHAILNLLIDLLCRVDERLYTAFTYNNMYTVFQKNWYTKLISIT